MAYTKRFVIGMTLAAIAAIGVIFLVCLWLLQMAANRPAGYTETAVPLSGSAPEPEGYDGNFMYDSNFRRNNEYFIQESTPLIHEPTPLPNESVAPPSTDLVPDIPNITLPPRKRLVPDVPNITMPPSKPFAPNTIESVPSSRYAPDSVGTSEVKQ